MFRRATEADMLLYFDWVNDKDVRQNAVSKGAINFEDHKVWFARKVKDKDTLMLIFLENGLAKGQLRIEMESTEKQGVIDYSIDKLYRGKGLGKVILTEGSDFFFRLYPSYMLAGIVKKENEPSLKAFKKAGFKPDPGALFINNDEYIKFVKNA